MQNALSTGEFFIRNFGNLSQSIPSTILSVTVTFIIIYGLAQLWFRRNISKQVEKITSALPGQGVSVDDRVPLDANAGDTKVSNGGGKTTTILKSQKVNEASSSYQPNANSYTMKTNASGSTQRTNQPVGATMRFNVDFTGAGVGVEAQNIEDGVQNDDATDIGGDPLLDANYDPNQYTAIDSPTFALPGFLQLNFTEDLRLKGKIAEGGGGVIYKGELLNREFIDKFSLDQVVVKVLKPLPHMSFADLKSVVFQEIAIMQSLSHHSNSITLIGYTDEPLSIVTKLYDRNMFSLVMSLPEYASNAADFEALKSFVKTESKLKKGLIVKGFEMLPEIALHLAWGVAAGMNEMHQLGILHRDLKSANVLLEYKASALSGEKPPWMANPSLAAMAQKISGSFSQNSLAGGVGWGTDSAGKPFCPVNPVVCDFGLAKVVKKQTDSSSNHGGNKEINAVGISYRYAAPEAFNRMYSKGLNQTEEAKPVDVYAFAIIVWELLERKVPFHKLSNKEIEGMVKAGERPAINSMYRDFEKPVDSNKHYPVIVKLIDKCWKQNARDRPSFFEVKQKLKPFWLGYKDPRDFVQAEANANSSRLPTSVQRKHTQLFGTSSGKSSQRFESNKQITHTRKAPELTPGTPSVPLQQTLVMNNFSSIVAPDSGSRNLTQQGYVSRSMSQRIPQQLDYQFSGNSQKPASLSQRLPSNGQFIQQAPLELPPLPQMPPAFYPIKASYNNQIAAPQRFDSLQQSQARDSAHATPAFYQEKGLIQPAPYSYAQMDRTFIEEADIVSQVNAPYAQRYDATLIEEGVIVASPWAQPVQQMDEDLTAIDEGELIQVDLNQQHIVQGYSDSLEQSNEVVKREQSGQLATSQYEDNAQDFTEEKVGVYSQQLVFGSGTLIVDQSQSQVPRDVQQESEPDYNSNQDMEQTDDQTFQTPVILESFANDETLVQEDQQSYAPIKIQLEAYPEVDEQSLVQAQSLKQLGLLLSAQIADQNRDDATDYGAALDGLLNEAFKNIVND